MYQILYISTAALGVDRDTANAIAGRAVDNNRREGITGAMGFNGTNFIQLIEGERDAVLSMYDRIAKDDRHHGITLMDSKHVDARAFPNWEMRMIEGLNFDEILTAAAR